MSEFLPILESLMPISDELKPYLCKIFTHRIFSKGEYLAKAGRHNDNFFLISKGLIRCYYYKDEQQISSNFKKEGDWTFSVEAFYNRKLNNHYIVAMEPTEAWFAKYNDFSVLYSLSNEFNELGRLMAEHDLIELVKQLAIIRRNPAVERYRLLKQNNSEICRRVPKKYIASFIDLSETYISKMYD